MSGLWDYIKPDAPANDDPAEHAHDSADDCKGVCAECGTLVPLGYTMCTACGGDE
jgi:hypothetical protein